MPSALSPQLLLQTDDVAALLDNQQAETVLPAFVGSEEAFRSAHLPGSIHIYPAQLVCGVAPAVGKLPDADDLQALFSNAGLTTDTIVIAYDDEGGGWAGRLIWTLDVIGHRHYHYLDGGIIAWLTDGLATQQGAAAKAVHTDYTVDVDSQQLTGVDEIVKLLDEHQVAIWDARSPQEHSGEKIIAARGGHMPGAINLDWLELMDRGNALRLKPLEDIRSVLLQRGIGGDKPVITHCQTHHRSGLSYLVGKLLGLDIRAYDGSWSEWGNLPDTPIESDV